MRVAGQRKPRHDWAIRPAATCDLSALRAVRAAAIRMGGAGHYAPAQLRAWISSSSPHDYPGGPAAGAPFIDAVAHRGDQVLGFATLRLGDRPHLWMTYVRPDCFGQGIGAALVRRVETLAAEQGLRLVEVAAALDAVAFYRALGYIKGAPFEARLAPRSSSARHAILSLPVVAMHRDLAPA